jgi:hypothetical protein
MTDNTRDDGKRREPDEEHFDEQVRADYQRALESDGAARERLLSRLAGAGDDRAEGEGRTRVGGAPGGLRWWFSVQPIALRPAWALGALALLLAGTAWLGARLATMPPLGEPVAGVPDAMSPAATSAGSPVTFVLRAPGATRVSVAGDFNNWDAEATPMTHTGTGDLWILNLTLSRGVHRYSFVLDGSEWRPDPSAPLAADETFGGHNSVIVVNGASGL